MPFQTCSLTRVAEIQSTKSTRAFLNFVIKLLYVVLFLSLQRLYNLGARRVLVTGTGPLGCVPAELAMRGSNGGCSAELQRAASLYNPQLEKMLQGLNRKIGKTVFIAANTQQMHLDFISNPQAYGMRTTKTQSTFISRL